MLARHLRAALKSTARLAIGGITAALTAGAAFAGSGNFTSGASLAVNGTCTAVTPYTQVAVTMSLTGATNDGFGTDDFAILILDDQNTVVGTGIAFATIGQTTSVTRNAFVRQAPNAGPYVMVLEDQGTFGTQLGQTYVVGANGPELDRFTFDLNALDPDCPAAADTTPPAVLSIVLSGSPAANATSVSYTVTFDEAALNVTSDDFSLTATGTAAGTIQSVTG
ncbi:MAG: hypothetical protein NXI12_14385, partial [Alphaproteobacteria bacterium]|nr:hypothetical protein [Alphaproteobacteria bacterium]